MNGHGEGVPSVHRFTASAGYLTSATTNIFNQKLRLPIPTCLLSVRVASVHENVACSTARGAEKTISATAFIVRCIYPLMSSAEVPSTTPGPQPVPSLPGLAPRPRVLTGDAGSFACGRVFPRREPSPPSISRAQGSVNEIVPSLSVSNVVTTSSRSC